MILCRHSDIELTIEKCKQTLHHLDDPDDDSPILKVHTNLLSQIITQIRSSYKDLTSSQIELDAIWKSVDEGIRKQISLKEKKEEADKVRIHHWNPAEAYMYIIFNLLCRRFES